MKLGAFHRTFREACNSVPDRLEKLAEPLPDPRKAPEVLAAESRLADLLERVEVAASDLEADHEAQARTTLAKATSSGDRKAIREAEANVLKVLSGTELARAKLEGLALEVAQAEFLDDEPAETATGEGVN